MHNNALLERILTLSQSYSSDKEFLQKCRIERLNLLSDLKSGRIKAPGADFLAKIIKGTGCSGTWLLTGEGNMFESRQNTDGPGGIAGSIVRAFELLDRIEREKGALIASELPPDIDLQLARLLTKILEDRHTDN